ncbi:MAG: SDR family oxidoreductase [Candidatus Edwardsbacteria bacterium]|jgi:NAD(P)-dependent dehydrogenase (short-subunit alcohol dehydrogenase family)|nr:SDR family oxidoreductase [Candidatus Edwardsbacteria bacterium]
MIIITGASKGIGLYLMGEFIREEQDVIGLFNSTAPNKNVGSMRRVDVADPADVAAFAAAIKKRNGSKMVLINCAGVNYNALAHKADPARWARLITVNLVGTFHVINALLPMMREQRYGRIINLSSVVAQKAVPGTSAYAASKAGLWGMTRAIAAENADRGITINNINLGYFDIGMISDVPTELREEVKRAIPSRALGEPSEILTTIKYLISCGYITGTSIDVNGGLY